MRQLVGWYHYLRHVLSAAVEEETWQEALRRQVSALGSGLPYPLDEEATLFVSRTFILAAWRALTVGAHTERTAAMLHFVEDAYKSGLGVAPWAPCACGHGVTQHVVPMPGALMGTGCLECTCGAYVRRMP